MDTFSGHHSSVPASSCRQKTLLFREIASSEADRGKLQNVMKTPLVAPENGQTTVLTGTTVHSPDCDTVLAANSSTELGGCLTHRLK